MSIEVRFALQRGEFGLDAQFTVPQTGVSALFGPSGCGKTTLLRAIAGLEPAAEGYCRVGEELWQEGGRSLPTHRRPLGMVFQEVSLFPHLDVRGNLAYGLQRVPRQRRRIELEEAAALLGIERFLHRDTQGLSGGERQRVAIARAILTSPRLLLMDEPLAALDRAGKAEILPFLERLHAGLGIPVIYVSHAPDEVARLADHLLLMEAGRIVAGGPIGEMLTRFDLPLARSDEAEALIKARVVDYDREFRLSRVAFAGGYFTVAGRELPAGSTVRLRVQAKDVSLTLERQQGTSILNIFPARVDELTVISDSQVLVRLDVNGVALLSRITRKSAVVLDLAAGRQLFAQVKSVALLA